MTYWIGRFKQIGVSYRRRCVRSDELSATVRCHYLTDGSVNFAFTVRRAEYFIPAGVLLKCFLDVSDRELFGHLLALAPDVRAFFFFGGCSCLTPPPPAQNAATLAAGARFCMSSAGLQAPGKQRGTQAPDSISLQPGGVCLPDSCTT